jgi:methylase of polypeptide subunit release factors
MPKVKATTQAYFEDARVFGVRGVVETPTWLVDLMVDLAIDRFEANTSAPEIEPRWVDPCTGAGAFVEGILRRHLAGQQGPWSVDALPRITAVDIHSEAIKLTTEAVDRMLQPIGLGVDQYLNSGRLEIIQDDFLRMSSNHATLLDLALSRADVVIGNPPYVRSRELTPAQRGQVQAAFPEQFSGGADLYTYFYLGAANLLSALGVACFVTPFSFMRVKGASKIRSELARLASLDSCIDFGERKIFEGVSSHIGVFCFSRSEQSQVRHADLSNRGHTQFMKLEPTDWRLEQLTTNAVGGWALAPRLESTNRKTRRTRPLADCQIKSFSGIRPGHSAAFLLDRSDAETLQPESRAWLEPILRGKDLARWTAPEATKYLLNTTRGSGRPTPEILDRLEAHRDSLESRHEVRHGSDWFELRSCAYLTVMRRPKIAFPDIASQGRFSLVGAQTLILDGAFFLDSSDPALLGVLNSSLALEYFKSTCPTIGNPTTGGRLRFKKGVIDAFPLPIPYLENDGITIKLRQIVGELLTDGHDASSKQEHAIDALVEQLYGGEIS